MISALWAGAATMTGQDGAGPECAGQWVGGGCRDRNWPTAHPAEEGGRGGEQQDPLGDRVLGSVGCGGRRGVVPRGCASGQPGGVSLERRQMPDADGSLALP